MSISPPSSFDEDSTINLPPESAAIPKRVRVSACGLTDRGKVRTNNEDNFMIARMSKSLRIIKTSLKGQGANKYSEEDAYLLIVADGLGGAAAGEEASAATVATIENFALNAFKWFLHFRKDERDQLCRELQEALTEADHEVFRIARENRSQGGMGSTLTMGYSVGNSLYLVHAGDSRAYILRGSDFEQITHDHTYVQMLIDSGAITESMARTHARRNVVTNVVGGPEPGVHAEIHKAEIRDGDVLLLCTDGLTEHVPDETIHQVLLDHPDPKAACQRLLTLALDDGGRDNITIVVARYHVDETIGL
ncbi:protein phosphatase 2C domain-containing protein [soil metagenome]